MNGGYRVPGAGYRGRGSGYGVQGSGYGVITEEGEMPAVVYDVAGVDVAQTAVRARDRVLLMIILATTFLFVAFGLNWEINRDAFHVVEMSDVLQDLGPVESSVVALAVAAFVVSLPEMRKRLPFALTAWHIGAIVGGTLLLVYIIVGEPVLFVIVIVQTFVLVFYSAPLIFGLYGTLHHRPVHLVISAMFFFFIMGGLPKPDPEDWPVLLASAVFFLLFLEVAESSIRCWHMLDARKLSEEQLASFVDHYLRNLALFMSMGALLTIFIIRLPIVVGAMGLKAVAASLELGSPYGQMTAAVVVLGGLGLLRFLHDRGYTAPWIRRLRGLAARARGKPEQAEDLYKR